MQDFESKRNALFACLDDASKELKGTKLDQESEEYKRMKTINDLVHRRLGNSNISLPMVSSLHRMRGKKSIFKKPELPIGRCLKPRKIPDFEANPHKWKKYSLSEVDISDHTNTTAAFAFLKEIDEQRDSQVNSEIMETSTSEIKKIEFKKSSNIKCNLKAIETNEVPDAEVDKPKLKGSKLVMPEYVVGQKAPKSERVLKQNVDKRNRAAGTALKLDHLQADDEEFE